MLRASHRAGCGNRVGDAIRLAENCLWDHGVNALRDVDTWVKIKSIAALASKDAISRVNP
jgi:hypothetical protein